MRPSTFAGGVDTHLPDFQVIAKTQGVIAYHQDPEQEGRPLMLLLGGAALALTCLVLIGALCFRTFYEHRIDPDQAYFGISLLFCFYVLGVFLFAYAYELYNLPRALRLTIIAALISLVFIILVIVSLSTLAKMKEGVVAIAEEANATANNPVANTLISYMGGSTAAQEAEAARIKRLHGGYEDFITPDLRPYLLNCKGCDEMFTPVPPSALCPHCGRSALTS